MLSSNRTTSGSIVIVIVNGSGVGVTTAARTAIARITYPRFLRSWVVVTTRRRVRASTPTGIWNSSPTPTSMRTENR